jgi:hypothetical protein
MNYFKKLGLSNFAVLSVGVALTNGPGLISTAQATVIGNTTGVTSGTASGFDAGIDPLDLIDTGQPTLSGVTATANAYNNTYQVAGLHDGSAAATGNLAYWLNTTSIVTFTLDTGVNTQGYKITNITSVAGFGSGAGRYGNQTFDISYSTDGVNFLPLTSVSYQPYATNNTNAGSSKVTLTDTTGTLATNVKALRFSFLYSPTFTETAVYREIDVIGVAVPEPGCGVMLVTGLLGIAVSRRRRSA